MNYPYDVKSPTVMRIIHADRDLTNILAKE